MELGAMEVDEYDHIANPKVKAFCDALVSNLDPEEPICVRVLFHSYNRVDDDSAQASEWRVERVSEGNKALCEGEVLCKAKHRLDIVRAICNSPKHIVKLNFGYLIYQSVKLGTWNTEVREEWSELMQGLKNHCTLRSLTLQIRHTFKEDIDHWNFHIEVNDEWVEAMANMLTHHPSLVHFEIRGLNTNSFGMATSLAKALSSNEKIETCTLEFCGVNASFLDELLQPFMLNNFGIQSKLRELYLYRMGDHGMNTDSIPEVIGNMLRKNTTLIKFGYDGTSMDVGQTSTTGFIILLKALKENHHLKHVRFEGHNFVGKEIFAEIMSVLQKNPSLRFDFKRTRLYRHDCQELLQAILSDNFQTTTPTSARVFFCGFPYAGKTTLRKSLVKISLLQKKRGLQKVILKLQKEQLTSRTTGIEVVTMDTLDAITLQLWDLGGQDEFHALHDLVVPNLGDNGGARCIFLLVCSVMNSPDNTTLKDEKNIKQELLYWLKFILSNSTCSSITCKPHVIIAFTHVDLVPNNLDTKGYVNDLMGSLRRFCGQSINIFEQGVFHVNAKDRNTVEELAIYLGEYVANLLTNAPKVNEACLTMEVAIAKLNKAKPHKPFLKWGEFVVVCLEEQKAFITLLDEGSEGLQKICKAMAMALHDSGHVIYFESLDFVVVDPNWFCNKILGPMLSRVDDICNGEALTYNDGYMDKKVFNSILEDSCLDKKNVRKGIRKVEGVEMVDVIELMKKMNLCYSSDNDVSNLSQQQDINMPVSKVFIPATLRDENDDAQQGRRQLTWLPTSENFSSNSFTYVGRRLQCEDVDRTFLTLGFFPRLQVVFRRTFGYPNIFFLKKNLISFIYNGMEILVEYSGYVAPMHLNNLIDGYIDILVKSSRDLERTLQFIQEEVVKQIRELCSSPQFGCQGVILVESILNPKCVEQLWLCKNREYHAIEVDKLIQDVLIQGDLEYTHEWPLCGPKEQPMRNSTKARLLLGERKWEIAVVDKLYIELKEIESHMEPKCVLFDGQVHVDDPANTILELDKMIKDEFKRHTKIVIDRIDLAENRLATKMDAIIALQHRLIPKISRNLDKVMAFSEKLQQRQVPYLVYFTIKDLSTGQWLITSLVPGLSSVQLHLMCEHEEGIHRVDFQKGDVLVLESETIQSIRPYVIWGLKILSILMKAGAQAAVGGGSMVPNLDKMLLKGVAEMIPNVPRNLGEGCVQSEQVNLDSKFQSYEQQVAEQWLVNFLRGKDIGVLFGLYRIKYIGSDKIAWVCKQHKEEGCKKRNIVLLPTS